VPKKWPPRSDIDHRLEAELGLIDRERHQHLGHHLHDLDVGDQLLE
jgi:hypothetical protein